MKADKKNVKYYKTSIETGDPLSGAVEVNGLIFVSGQIHADENWNVIGNTMEERFEIVINRIRLILDEADLGLEDIVKVKMLVTDITEFPDLNYVYSKYFNRHPMPVRTTTEVKSLPLGATLEIEVVASR